MPRSPAARACRQVVLCRDGDLLRLAPGGRRNIDEVPAGRLYKDGSLLVKAEERTVADRRRLGFAGMVSVALALTDRGELLGDPRGRAHRHSRKPTRSARIEDSPMTRRWRRSSRCRERAGAIPKP